jgi:hypothetical protein
VLRTVPPLLLALAGCQPDPKCDVDAGCPDSTETPTDGSQTPTGDTATAPTTEPTTVDVCEVSPALEVLDVTVVDGRLGVDRALLVQLNQAATVAALCTADDDPTEQHLVVSDTPATDHELRFQGLLPRSYYTCQVAPTCPRMAEPAASVPVPTGGVPPLPQLEVEVDPNLGMTGYWTLLSHLDGACSPSDRHLILYDGEGVARWWEELPDSIWIDVEALYHPEDDAIVWGGGDDAEGRARVVDLWHGETAALPLPPEDTEFSHDAKRLPDGRLLTLDYRPNDWNNATFTGFGVQIHDLATGRIDFDLSSQRYVDEGSLPGAFWGDAYHANWLEWVPDAVQGDRLYVSLCYEWSILAIDPATGDLRYNLARDQGWTVLDEAGAEIGEDALPSCTHGNEVVGDDALLVYDNGRALDYSQITEWSLDPATRTAQRTFQWSEPDWYETTLGDVDDLGNGRILVTQAHPECWTSNQGDVSEIVEVDRATGAVASRLRFPTSSHTTYRAERYDGCAIMSNTRACPELAAQAEALAPLVGW